MKRVGILFMHEGRDGVDAAAGIDAALATLAFDHALSVAFVGAGVELLRSSDVREPQIVHARMIAALHHHGATSLLASSECLGERGLAPDFPWLNVVPRAALLAWLEEVDHVLAF